MDGVVRFGGDLCSVGNDVPRNARRGHAPPAVPDVRQSPSGRGVDLGDHGRGVGDPHAAQPPQLAALCVQRHSDVRGGERSTQLRHSVCSYLGRRAVDRHDPALDGCHRRRPRAHPTEASHRPRGPRRHGGRRAGCGSSRTVRNMAGGADSSVGPVLGGRLAVFGPRRAKGWSLGSCGDPDAGGVPSCSRYPYPLGSCPKSM